MTAVPGQVFDFTVNDTSLTGLIAKVNSFTDVGQGGMFGIFILMVVAFPLFLMMRSYGNERAFAVSAFITGFIALFLRLFSLINDTVLTICIILSAIGVILLLKEAANYEN